MKSVQYDRRVFALQFLIALALCVPCQGSNENEIPLTSSRNYGLLLVHGEINDRAAVFILDTGSSVTAVNSDLLRLEAHSAKKQFTSGKGSGVIRRGQFAKAKLRLGTVVCASHDVVIMDLNDISSAVGQKVDGILGIDFLHELAGVELGVKKGRLILDP